MTRPSRRQLYERIRQSSKDEVILEEMIRLGFWPDDREVPNLPADVIKRQGELERELRQLATQLAIVNDPEQALKELRKQCLKAAREQRRQTRMWREQERHRRASAWRERRQRELLFLGQGFSAGLNDTSSDRAKLQTYNLPLLETANEAAGAMGIELAELRFLCFTRDVARHSHYQRFEIAKKSGGARLISAPMPRLKRAQYWILDNILLKVSVHDAAHGFVPGRSIVSNAQQHCAAELVVNLDFKDFFPTIVYPRIKGVFKALGYGEQLATVFALLCSEADADKITLDGERYFVSRGPRYLPQGAPTSPALSNIICRRLDARLAGCAASLDYAYTRYADDLSFSASGEARKRIRKLLWRIEQITTSEGFALHPDKLRIMRRNGRQDVTGLLVNNPHPAINRTTLRRFRAVLHQIENNGPDGKSWGNSDDVLAAIAGFAHYVAMVDAAKGGALVEQVKRIHAAHGYQMPKAKPNDRLGKAALRRLAAAGEKPRPDWWQPKPPPAPQPPPSAPATESVQERVEQTIKAQSEAVQTIRVESADQRAVSFWKIVGGLLIAWLIIGVLAYILE